jgi:hypothetical protein
MILRTCKSQKPGCETMVIIALHDRAAVYPLTCRKLKVVCETFPGLLVLNIDTTKVVRLDATEGDFIEATVRLVNTKHGKPG